MRTLSLLLALTSFATVGFASTSYSLPTGSEDTASEAVAGSAIFSLSLVGSQEVLTIVLENLTANPRSDGQNLTGVSFDMTGLAATGSTLVGSNADLIDVAGTSGGVVTDMTPTSAEKVNDLTHWGVTATSLNDLTLSTFTGDGPPIQGVAGAPNSSGLYSNGNSSFDQGGAKLPYANQTATFTVDLVASAGSNLSLSGISNVELDFGTTSNADLIAATVVTNIATPEPCTFWLLGFSALLIGLASQRKRLTTALQRN